MFRIFEFLNFHPCIVSELSYNIFLRFIHGVLNSCKNLSKTVTLKKTKNWFSRPIINFLDQLSLNAGQKYFRMLQMEHSEIHLTFIKLPIVIKIFVLSIFEWPFYTGFSVVFLTEQVGLRLTFSQTLSC